MAGVVIVDDHALVVETVRICLQQRGVSVRAVPPAPTAALTAAVLEVQPALVLLDLDLGPHGSSIDTIAALAAAGVRVLVVTGTTDRIAIAQALEAGAIGYQPKSAGFDALLDGCERALAASGSLDLAERARLFDELLQWRVARARESAPFLRLTERERATLQALGDGETVQAIARDWVVSEATVRTHVRGVLGKLGESSQLAAVARARRAGFLASARTAS